MGNMNLQHRPLRKGKWAVSFEEWPTAVYPPYANGPGYIISSDIAKYIVDQHRNRSLKLFKMEDVSMGMWVQQFNSSTNVKYYHSWKFCQYGCVPGYHTSHYQSPKQMMCLWEKLGNGHAQCCNFRWQHWKEKNSGFQSSPCLFFCLKMASLLASYSSSVAPMSKPVRKKQKWCRTI